METMTTHDAVELIEEARAEGVIAGGGGLEAFTALEERLGEAPSWLPLGGSSWETAAAAHPFLIEEILVRVLDDGVEPAELAASWLEETPPGGGTGGIGIERVMVACELAAQSATSEQLL